MMMLSWKMRAIRGIGWLLCVCTQLQLDDQCFAEGMMMAVDGCCCCCCYSTSVLFLLRSMLLPLQTLQLALRSLELEKHFNLNKIAEIPSLCLIRDQYSNQFI